MLDGARARGRALELRCDALEDALVRIRDEHIGGAWSANLASWIDGVLRGLTWIPNRPSRARESK
jgi:hypothetical protein